MQKLSLKNKIAMPLLASIAFDISIFESFLPILSGGKAIMLNDSHIKDVFHLSEKLKNVNAFHAVPALMQLIINNIKEQNSQSDYQHIREIFIGGDAVPNSVLKDISEVFPKANINVLYGPTEGTIFTTTNQSKNTKEPLIGAILGKPNPHTKLYVLDNQMNLCPIGVAGEICIGGAGVAKGYLNKSEMSKSKFVKNPFRKGEKIYKTGDLGLWLPNGTIEFKGRKDSQVKIRGYRIELGEIENTLEKYPDIESAVVLAIVNKQAQKELVAYVVGGSTLKISELRSHIGKTLPSYMIPNHFVELEEMPLTANGKVDRKQLGNRELSDLQSGTTEYVAPRSEVEEKMVAIWQEVLDKNKIGIKDDFFELGGDSLKIGQLLTRINKNFMVKIDLKSVFMDPTIENVSDQIEFILNQRKHRDNKSELVEIEI